MIPHFQFHLTRIRQTVIPISILLGIILLCTSCGFPRDDRPLVSSANAFMQAIEQKHTAIAIALLSKDTLSRIEKSKIASANGDFQPVIEAFRQANITTRTSPPKNEPSFVVKNLRGRQGTIKFVIVQEGGQWKIANILED